MATDSTLGEALFPPQPESEVTTISPQCCRRRCGSLSLFQEKAIGNDRVEAISTGDTSHRGTFAKAVPQWKARFDGK